MKAFISYAREDRPLLDRIIPVFKDGYGIEVHTDSNMPKGVIWSEWVLREIKENDYVILLVTEAYQRSLDHQKGACHAEYTWIVNHFIEQGTTDAKIVAIIEHGTVPQALAAINHINLRDQNDVVRAIEQEFASLVPQGSSVPAEHDNRIQGGGTRSYRPVRVQGPQDLRYVVKYNFERNARRYSATLQAQNSMQRKNAVELLRLLKTWCDQGQIPQFDSWMDVGCGTGLVGNVAQYAVEEHLCDWVSQAKTRIGFDNAPGMLDVLKTSAASAYSDVFEADLREMTPGNFRKWIPERLGLIMANNVFHWLLDPVAIRQSFQACREILINGGALVASIAAIGTGSDFFEAYGRVLKREVRERYGEKGLNMWADFLENPIGLQNLRLVVGYARDNFKILEAKMTYEPVRYDNTDQYVDAARGYGNDVFMAPLFSTVPEDQQESDQEQVWNAIKEEFRTLHSAKFERRAYIHDQYMIYVLLRGL